MNAQTHPILDAALAYAAKGWPIFPCGGNKQPLTPNGFKDATTDPETIRGWWRQWPAAMIGLPCGPGLAVVDLDIDKTTGEATGEATARELGILDAVKTGLMVRTPSGGWHAYFFGTIHQTNKIGPKIDTRGDGKGYVIAPPSVCPAGAYTWDGPSLLDAPLPLLPDCIADLAARAVDRIRPATAATGGAFQFDTGRQPGTGYTDAEVLGLLHTAPNDLDRDDWVRLCHAVKSELGNRARDSFIAFSDRWTGGAVGLRAGARLWDGAKPDGSAGLGTVVHLLDPQRHALRRDSTPPRAATAHAPRIDQTRQEAPADTPPAPLAPTPFALGNPAAIPPRRWLYDKHMIGGYPSLTVAPGGLGKSSLLMAEAVAMATGRDLIGAKPPRPLRVWYWCGEDPADEIARRVTAICLHYNITADQIGGRLFTDSGRNVPICLVEETRKGLVVHQPLVDEMVTAIQAAKIDVLICDPFVTTHAVSENDNGAINRAASLWREIADRTGCAVELVHHAQKAALAPGADIGIAQSRGASALIDAVRSARYLVGMTAEEAAKAGLDTHHGTFRVENGKANLAPRGTDAVWRRMVSVSLGNGSGLYPEGDHVGVATAWEWPDAFDGVELSDLAAVQAAIAAGEWKASDQATDWAGYAVADALGLDPGARSNATRDQKAARAKIKGLLKSWIKSGALVEITRYSTTKGRDIPMIECGEAAFETASPLPHQRVGKCGEGGE